MDSHKSIAAKSALLLLSKNATAVRVCNAALQRMDNKLPNNNHQSLGSNNFVPTKNLASVGTVAFGISGVPDALVT